MQIPDRSISFFGKKGYQVAAGDDKGRAGDWSWAADMAAPLSRLQTKKEKEKG